MKLCSYYHGRHCVHVNMTLNCKKKYINEIQEHIRIFE